MFLFCFVFFPPLVVSLHERDYVNTNIKELTLKQIVGCSNSDRGGITDLYWHTVCFAWGDSIFQCDHVLEQISFFESTFFFFNLWSYQLLPCSFCPCFSFITNLKCPTVSTSYPWSFSSVWWGSDMPWQWWPPAKLEPTLWRGTPSLGF